MSRNHREGRYAGKLYGQHWRSRFYRSPKEYSDHIAPYLTMVVASTTFRKSA